MEAMGEEIGAQSSDLALERMRAPLGTEGVILVKDKKILRSGIGVNWERIKISSDEGAREIGRPKGNYDTLALERMDKLSAEDISEVAKELAAELILALSRIGAASGRLLIVGLGNASLTPDSIGPKAAAEINATLHISKYDVQIFEAMQCSEIAVIAPGVTADSGMDASAIAAAVAETLLPDAVIAIDSLAARSPSRLGTTVQISDTGIFPGGGIGNKRSPLNERSMGAPVIAIGIPTVISASLLSGEAGELKDMFVSPREIDGIAKNGAMIISKAINLAFGIV